ncbi:TPA: LysR family transcriptional regulator [Candidatus Bathyarchaeota archaeon]|nr:LysR family transcriptional regulator [Candidatus Bathyarchaeota archaeon]
MAHSKPHPAFKVWMETEDGYVFGPGVYSLLKKVMEVGTLKEASTELGMSYRYAWGLIRKAEEKLGEPLLSAHKGGKSGGGGAELTERGKKFLIEFRNLCEQMRQVSEAPSQNIIYGTVKDVNVGVKDVDIVIRMPASRKPLFKKGDGVILRKNT